MSRLRSFVFILPLLLAGCGLSPQEKADYASVQESGVSPAIYDKMIHYDPLSVSDVCALARARVNDGVVLRYIRNEGTIYVLNSADVDRLRHAGVSDSVIDYMMQTAQYVPPPVVVYPAFYSDPFWGPPCYPGYGPYHRWH